MRIFETTIGTVILCIILGAGFPRIADGGTATTLDREKLFGLYEKFITDDIPFPAADIKIANFSCRPMAVTLSAGTTEYIPFMGSMSGRLGHRSIDLNIFVDGVQVKSIKMAADLQLYGEVIIAKRSLKRNTVITQEDINVSRRDITMLGPDLVTDREMLVGQQLKKTLRPGAIFFKSFLKPPQIIQRGDMVAIIAEGGGVHISVLGQAKSAGALGESIRVKNMMSRREVHGLVSNDKEVRVTF